MRPKLFKTKTVDWFGFRAYADNLPLHWPGCYSIIEWLTGRVVYIGQSRDVYGRLSSWSRIEQGRQQLLHEEIERKGHSAFIVKPLYYLRFDPSIAFDPDSVTKLLQAVEQALIQEFGTAWPNGFNFGNENRITKLTAAWTAERRLQQSLKRKQYLADPENAKQHAETARTTVKRADVRVKNSLAVSSLVWINDGTHSRRIKRNALIPEGWQPGRALGPKFGPQAGKIKFQWITNGTDNRHWPLADPMPEGWYPGKVHVLKSKRKRRRSTANDNRKPIAPFTEERKQNISEGLRTYFANEDPAVKAARSTRAHEQVTEHWKDPEYRENILASRATVREKTNQSLRNAWARNHDERVAALQTPEYKAKLAARPVMARGTIWITDGSVNKRIPADQPIPSGWHRGTRPRSAAGQTP